MNGRRNIWKAATVYSKTPCNTIILIGNYDENGTLCQTHIYVREVETLLDEALREFTEEIENLNIENDKIKKLINIIKRLMDAWDRRSCQQCLLETISRLISLCLKNNIPLSHILDELHGMRCNASAFVESQKINISCPHAIYNGLKRLRKQWKYDDEDQITGREKTE